MKKFHEGKLIKNKENSFIGGLSSLRMRKEIPDEIAHLLIFDSSDSSKEQIERFAPVDLEIGCGKGRFILNYASRYPGRRIAGIEARHNRLVKIARRIISRGIENIILIRMDAREAISPLFTPYSIERCFLLFPDPWWKRTHVKKRLATTNFATMIFNIMKENGHVFFASDVLILSNIFVECFLEVGFAANEGFTMALPETDREIVIKRKGGDIFYYTFTKRTGELKLC